MAAFDPEENRPVVLCMGEILIDFFPAELGKKLFEVSAFHPKPGGAPANVAVAAEKLGAHSAFIGKVGDDPFGSLLIDVVRSQGVETCGMCIDANARTTLAFIAKPDPNTSEFIFYRNPGADMMIDPSDLDAGLFSTARAFHFGSLGLKDEPARSATHEAVRMARKAGALVSFDPNYRPNLWPSREQALEQVWAILPKVDLLKVNEFELQLLAGQNEDLPAACQALLAKGPNLIAVTLGEQGSFYCTSQINGMVPAFPVDAVDATGCGDAFMGALLSRLVSTPGWRTQLEASRLAASFRFANAAAAITALNWGGISALPKLAELEDFLRTA